jgi:hypothetical protein
VKRRKRRGPRTETRAPNRSRTRNCLRVDAGTTLEGRSWRSQALGPDAAEVLRETGESPSGTNETGHMSGKFAFHEKGQKGIPFGSADRETEDRRSFGFEGPPRLEELRSERSGRCSDGFGREDADGSADASAERAREELPGAQARSDPRKANRKEAHAFERGAEPRPELCSRKRKARPTASAERTPIGTGHASAERAREDRQELRLEAALERWTGRKLTLPEGKPIRDPRGLLQRTWKALRPALAERTPIGTGHASAERDREGSPGASARGEISKG